MEQSLALSYLKSGFNVFLTGQAGTGKSYTLIQFMKYLRRRKINFAATASTGIAASHLDGMTIHSWSGIGVKTTLSQKDLQSIKNKKKHIAETAVLILDEISMFHSTQLKLIDQVFKFCRESDEPFGGMQIVVCGDFFQLPPVEQDASMNTSRFCFMSPTWVEAGFKVCYLDRQYRQDGNVLTTILNQIRDGSVTEDSRDAILDTFDNDLEGKELTRLFTHNIDVDTINNQGLKKLTTNLHIHECAHDGNESLCEMIMRQSRLTPYFEYKIGALVMFIKNDTEGAFCNGTTGVVVDVIKDDVHGPLPVVRKADGKEIVVVPENWKIVDEGGEALATVTTLPLRLAWAITIHKSQGMTLDAAEIDLSGCFEQGQGYVALSRLKSISGMRVLGLNDMAFSVAPIVRKADNRFKELSQEIEDKLTSSDFTRLQRDFYKQALDSGQCNSISKRFKRSSPPKGVVLKRNANQTKDLIFEGADLNALAKEKGITLHTLIKHIDTARKEDEEFDISFLKPSSEVLGFVSAAVKKYNLSGRKIPFFKNNFMFVENAVQVEAGVKILELEIWKAFLFLGSNGEVSE